MSSLFLANGPHISGPVRMGRKVTELMRRMTMEQQTSSPYQDSHEPASAALVHLITPVELRPGTPIHLSILPSFLTHLPPSIHTLRITFVLPRRFWSIASSKLSSISLEGLENVVESDGTLNLCITSEEKNNRSEVIFNLVARYSPEKRRFAPRSEWEEQCFVPISDWEESTISSTGLGTTIQLSLPPTRTTGIGLCTIAQLPLEILSLVFDFLSFGADEYLVDSRDGLVSFQRVSTVCQRWKAASVPYLDTDISMKERHARLRQYPHAGRLWTDLQFDGRIDDDISAKMAKEVILASTNVTLVYMDAFWNEEKAKIVLHVIEGLTRLDSIWFGGQGSRKWKKHEVENFVWRIGDRIRIFSAYGVEDSTSSTSPGLQLSSDLQRLMLHAYPPLQSLSLPQTLMGLSLSNLCPLPPSVSGSCLPPLLEDLNITLAPYSPHGKTSILSAPLDFSYLKHLTQLFLDGGEETSNLVSPEFLHLLRNARAIVNIDVRYCVVDWEFRGFVFSDFIRWFFGDRGVKGGGDMVDEAVWVKKMRGLQLRVQLFFGGWPEEAICMARSTLRELGVIRVEGDYRIWVREGGGEEH
ncbi:hypothetical protein BT69DRAFT_1306388 [Atractiella rhizophila]|nr:hypothetical protein BT69DRAFT_1306388 [Atractiella rhizophila]